MLPWVVMQACRCVLVAWHVASRARTLSELGLKRMNGSHPLGEGSGAVCSPSQAFPAGATPCCSSPFLRSDVEICIRDNYATSPSLEWNQRNQTSLGRQGSWTSVWGGLSWCWVSLQSACGLPGGAMLCCPGGTLVGGFIALRAQVRDVASSYRLSADFIGCCG